MKFERLELERFGHFESLRLDLRSPSGLVVIHGPNEAGKTTLLRAIHGLLFGIDERSPYAFRFPYQAMAIHATLQDSAGQRLELVRRKKRKDALLGNLRTDIGEVALDEPRFTRYFGSITPDLYRAVFGFTHADLQQGAELLQVAGLGELLGGGALGGGAEVVRRVLGDLRDEADALFKTRGKNPPINRNLGAIRDARNALRDATFQQPQYLALTQSLKDARDTLAGADTELARLRLRSARVHALLAAFEDFHAHQRLLARLADPELATPLHPADAERVRPLLVELRAREQRHRTLTDELERLERRAAQHPVDHPLLAESAAVERLVRRVESVTTRRRELPRERERLGLELAALRAEFTRLSGMSQETAYELSPETALTASPAELEQVRLALGRWRRTRQELQVLARGEADDEAELASLRVEASTLADQAPDERGASLLAELESAQAAHAELERGEIDLLRIDTELEQALARLHPRPPADALDRLPLPSFAAVQDMQARHLDSERERRDALDHLSQETAELARIEAELAALLAGEALPDPARLAEARQRRDEAWQLVRQQLLARTSANQRDLFGAAEPTPARVTDRRTLARGFERALADADQLADQLRSSADRLAQKTALTHAAERVRLALTRARERLATLDAAERGWTSAWRELWRPTGILPGAPGPMLAWLGDAASLRDLAATRLRRAHGLAPDRPRVQDFEARLRDHLVAGATTTWPALVSQLRERERNAQTRHGRLESTLARSSALEAALARTHTARHFIERDLASSADELQRRTAALGLRQSLDPEAAVERLEALADLSERTATNTRQRAANDLALAALADFDAELAALLTRLARAAGPGDPELQVESLSRDLSEARAAASTHALAREEAEDRRREQLRVSEALAEAQRDYDALLARAGVHDQAALLNMSERTLLRDQLERSCSELDLRLARALGEGEPRAAYESELRASRRESLISEQDALTRQIAELDQRRISAALQKGRHEHEAQQLGGDRAARIGADLEVLKSELEEQIDRYLLVHLAERVLDRVTDRYARENQPALLQHTSELFARVTEGRHLRVVVQPETRTLATVDRNGQLRSPADLSSGTREQLFLALRLAYILDYCDRSEPLPVIMDDVLVNFDDTRAAASLAALRDAARHTQVILLTCHRREVDITRSVAPEARIVELPGEAPPGRLARPAEA